MKRLIKDNKIILDGTAPEYEKEEQAFAKLSAFEDLEEELGIDLTKLFEILKSENIYANGKRYDNSNSLSYMGNSWLIFNHQAKQCFHFKDYGKTWALSKEELTPSNTEKE